MIEKIIIDHLIKKLGSNVYFEYPRGIQNDQEFVLIEKTSSAKSNYLPSATFAFQSYGLTLYKTAALNEKVKEAVESLIELDKIRSVKLNSDYNFTDLQKKKYRYQAVFDIGYYD